MTPIVTLLLVMANVAAYAIELRFGGMPVCEAYGLVPADTHASALFTSLFLHDPGSPWHLLGNMFFLGLFGTIVERAVGPWRMLAIYLAAGVFGGLMHILVAPESIDPLIGASGAVFGLIAVASLIRTQLLGFAVAFVGLEVFHAFTGTGGNVSFGTHLGGFAFGAAIAVGLHLVNDAAMMGEA